MNTTPSPLAQRLAASATFAMVQKAAELRAAGIDVISMSVGEPDFATPDYIKEAAHKAIDDNYSKYSPVTGYMWLREAVCKKLKNENNLDYTPAEIIISNGAKQALSTVVMAIAGPGDEVIVSEMEHHSNIVSWQLLQQRKHIVIRHVRLNERQELDMEYFRSLFTERTKLVSIAHVSNVLGTVNPVKDIVAYAHERNVPVLIDGAQSTPHIKVDVQDLDCDFLVFSAHKIYGPTGVGVLYGKRQWLEQMPPYQGGGEMIQNVSFEKTTFNELPYKFEAGTPDFINTVAFATALDYIEAIGMDEIAAYEHQLLEYCTEEFRKLPQMRIFGNAADKSAVMSFLVGDIHHYDMGMLLDKLGIAVRTGHHCAEPLMHSLGIQGTVRASFSFYNTVEEIDKLVAGIKRVSQMFGIS